MDRLPISHQQPQYMNIAYAQSRVNLLPDKPLCINQLYPTGAVFMPRNNVYAANLVNLSDLSRLYPQPSLQIGTNTVEDFSDFHIDYDKCLRNIRLISYLLLLYLLVRFA